MKMIKINLTRDGFSIIKSIVRRSEHLSETSIDFEWDWDVKTNRFSHVMFLHTNELDLLKFLFEVKLKNLSAFFVEPDIKNEMIAEKMIKRILKAIKKELV